MDQPINDTNLDQLADEGWKQMKVLLEENGLTQKKPRNDSKKFFWLMAALVLGIMICCAPFIFTTNQNIISQGQKETNTKNDVPANESRSPAPSSNSTLNNPPVANSASGIWYTAQNKTAKPQNSGGTTTKPNDTNGDKYTPFAGSWNRDITGAINGNEQMIWANGKEKENAASIQKTLPPHTNTFISESRAPFAKTLPSKNLIRNDFSEKIKLYGGAAINLPGSSTMLVDLEHLTIHPSLKMVLPLSSKFQLHAGLGALSTLHQEEMVKQEREDFFAAGPNVYYKINTVSIIKASYVDLSATLHFNIQKNWTAGTGIQLSKLYRLKIMEENKNFDNNNNLLSSTNLTSSVDRATAADILPDKTEIKKIDPRIIIETGYTTGRWMLSAGYTYGLGKTIEFQPQSGDKQQYRNQYFQAGVHFRLFGK